MRMNSISFAPRLTNFAIRLNDLAQSLIDCHTLLFLYICIIRTFIVGGYYFLEVNLTLMPTLLLLNGLRFFFWSNENEEPIHVHVTKGDANGKIWLEPDIKIEYWIGFSNSEQRDWARLDTRAA